MLIRYFASARQAAGTQSVEIDGADMDLRALKATLATKNAALAKVFETASFLADGVRVTDEDAPLAGVQQVDVLPPFAGG